jgi:hypothetical protein
MQPPAFSFLTMRRTYDLPQKHAHFQIYFARRAQLRCHDKRDPA